MHILLIGSGGREHALAWKLAQSSGVERVSVAPGNPGMADEPGVQCVDLAVDDFTALARFARDEAVHLTVVGPEVPLVNGIVDHFEAEGLRIFGPASGAAQLEGSKAYAKAFMQRHGIPTAAFARFTEPATAIAWIEERGAPIVIKADGLAAGKGVVVAMDLDEARAAVHSMLGEQVFGTAGNAIVVEAFLTGEEASFIVIVDGTRCLALATSQDHKARDEGDTGPNTGGMGACSPAPVVTPEVHAHVLADIVQPTVDGLVADGNPFTGFLYVGLMIDASGQARVVEYNVRLGDPETQPLLMRLKSDLLPLLDAAVDGSLDTVEAEWIDGSAIGVVLAAGSYPAGGSQGDIISGIESAESTTCKVFHAGTRREGNTLVTAGGRVLCVTATGATLADAKATVDAGCACIHWDGMRYRRDIGHRALQRS